MSKLFSISSEIVCSSVIFLFSKKVSMSFKNNEKRKGDRFSNCLTSFVQSKYSDIQLLYEIHYAILSYILEITLYILPLILFYIILSQNPSLHTLSKVFIEIYKGTK